MRGTALVCALVATACSAAGPTAEESATSPAQTDTVLSVDEAWVHIEVAWDHGADEAAGCAGLLADHRDQAIGVAHTQGYAWIDSPVTPASPDVLTDGTDVWVNADIGWDRDEIGSAWIRSDNPGGPAPPESQATRLLLATAFNAELRPDLGVAPLYLEVALHDLWDAVQDDFSSVELTGNVDLDGKLVERYALVGDGFRGEAMVTKDGILRQVRLPAIDGDEMTLGQPAMTITLASRRAALPFEAPTNEAPLLSHVDAPDLDLTVDCDLREALGSRLDSPGTTIGFAPAE